MNVHYFSGDSITGLGDIYCHRFLCPGCYTLIGPRWEIIFVERFKDSMPPPQITLGWGIE